MTALLAWSITVLVVVLLLAFAAYAVSLRAIPLAGRPRTRTFDRLGRYLGDTENPDYHENPGEDRDEEPDRRPA